MENVDGVARGEEKEMTENEAAAAVIPTTQKNNQKS